jgi:hypothetical protein
MLFGANAVIEAKPIPTALAFGIQSQDKCIAGREDLL